MFPIFKNCTIGKAARFASGALLAFALTACGGGGGSPGGNGTTPGTPGTVTPPVPVPTLTVAVVDSANKPTTVLTLGQGAVIRATLLDAAGLPVANALIKFSASDTTLVQFLPAATALTNVKGVAEVSIQPGDLNLAGALAVQADTLLAGKGFTATTNIAVAGGGVVGTTTNTAKFTISIVDGAGAPLTTLSGGQKATVRGSVIDPTGAPIAGAIVKFTTDNGALVQFNPDSASALTDATGVAVIEIHPTTVNSAGAVAIQGNVALSTKTLSAAINISVGAAPLTVGPLYFSPAPVAGVPLAAFSTVAINFPVTSGGQAVTGTIAPVLSSLCLGDGKADLIPGSLTNGIMSVTYVNMGCARGTDTITISIGSSSQHIDLPVALAGIGTIQFVGSDLQGQSIVLKGNGGQGRKESAVLTFKVLDQNNKGLGGVDVNFKATTTTGGLTVRPDKGTTDANGLVSTTVSSGTIPTPVRVIAQAIRNGVPVGGLSDVLTISTGLPIQRFMSLSIDHPNIEGLTHDGEVANVTVMLADQYGNPIADATVVNFVTEGGSIASSSQGACTTVNGGCSVQLRSQEFRPANGRVTVLAYVQGLENFVDTNGDGQYSCTNFIDPDTGVAPVNADNTLAPYRPLVHVCVSGGEPFTDQGDPFLDTGSNRVILGNAPPQAVNTTLDGVYDINPAPVPAPTRVAPIAPIQPAEPANPGLPDAPTAAQRAAKVAYDAYTVAYLRFRNGVVQSNGFPFLVPETALSAPVLPDNPSAAQQATYDALKVTYDAEIAAFSAAKVVYLAYKLAYFDWKNVLVPTYNKLKGDYDNYATAHATGHDQPFPFNHVGYRAAGDGHWGLNYIWRQAEVTFSGSTLSVVRLQCDPINGVVGACRVYRDWVAPSDTFAGDGDPAIINGIAGVDCKAQSVAFRLFDVNNNPAPFGTLVSQQDATKLAAPAITPPKVLSTNLIGGSIHEILVKTDPACSPGNITFGILTPLGYSTAVKFTSP